MVFLCSLYVIKCKIYNVKKHSTSFIFPNKSCVHKIFILIQIVCSQLFEYFIIFPLILSFLLQRKFICIDQPLIMISLRSSIFSTVHTRRLGHTLPLPNKLVKKSYPSSKNPWLSAARQKRDILQNWKCRIAAKCAKK